MTTPQRHRQRVYEQSEYGQWAVDALSPDGHWPLTDPVGASTAVDISGNGRDGTYQGAWALEQSSVVQGLANAAKPDPSTGYVELPNGDGIFDIGTGEAFSIMLWVRPYYVQDSVLFNTAASFDTSNDAGWWIESRIGGTEGGFRYSLGDGSSRVNRTPFQKGPWEPRTCIILTHDNAANESKQLMNGKTNSRSDDVGGMPATITPGICVYWGGGSGGDHGSSVQHVAFWTRVLSDAEMQAAYEQGARFWDNGRLL